MLTMGPPQETSEQRTRLVSPAPPFGTIPWPTDAARRSWGLRRLILRQGIVLGSAKCDILPPIDAASVIATQWTQVSLSLRLISFPSFGERLCLSDTLKKRVGLFSSHATKPHSLFSLHRERT